MKFIIPGNPIPKARPRFFQKGSITGCYDSQSKKKNAIRVIFHDLLRDAKRSGDEKIMFDAKSLENAECYSVEFVFYMPIADSLPTKMKNAMQWGFIEHIRVPDCDNMTKFYLDCMNGICYLDDCRVIKTRAYKRYCTNPRTEIILMSADKFTSENTKRVYSVFSKDELSIMLMDMHRLQEEIMQNNFDEPSPSVAQMLTDFAMKHCDNLCKVKRLKTSNSKIEFIEQRDYI